MIFDEIQYSWPLLSGLLFVAAKNSGVLNIVDFGGSLESTYFQNRKFLQKLDNLSWNVIEQKHFADVGKKEFEDGKLSFFYDVKSCKKEKKSNAILFSSVLQYIEKPYELLNDILSYGFDYVIFDRMPFSKDKEKITLQRVPSKIYKASYPCWLFDEIKFLQYFKDNGYKIIEGFHALDGESNGYIFKGFIMVRNV